MADTDYLRLMAPDEAARALGRAGEMGRPVALALPTDVELGYSNGLTLLHLAVMNFLTAAKSLGLATADAKELITRWGTFAEQELPVGMVEASLERRGVPERP